MTSYAQWCAAPSVVQVDGNSILLLDSSDDDEGIDAVAAQLPSRYAETASLQRIAESFGKAKVSEFLQMKFPQTQKARSGDLGEILATSYIHEDLGYVVGPSRLIHRDHQEWAMRGDDVLAARPDSKLGILLIKAEAKSRAKAAAAVVRDAREGLQREGGLPSPHSLIQFAERLLDTADEDLGDAILELLLGQGIRPQLVTHFMFLFTGTDPSSHVKADFTSYKGGFAQEAVILRVKGHQDFIRTSYEKAIADGA